MILERTEQFECQFWEDFKEERGHIEGWKENRRDKITRCIINQQEIIIERRAREGDVEIVPVKASVSLKKFTITQYQDRSAVKLNNSCLLVDTFKIPVQPF